MTSLPSPLPSPSPTLDVFEAGAHHEQVVFCNDAASGLRAIVAIHSTALGPALGGTRFYPYASTADALADVLDLSRGMSYKAALAGLDLGGGKAVILGDPATLKSEALLRAYGRFVAVARRSLLHRLRRGHVLRRHGRHRPRVLLRHRPLGRARRRRRQLGAHGVRRVAGHAGRRRVRLGVALARGPDRRCGRRRQGRSPPRDAPGRRGRLGGRHRRLHRGARPGPRRAPGRPDRRLDRGPGRPSSSTSTRPARSAVRSPTRSSRCCPRPSCAAPRTTSWRTRASRRPWPSAGSTTRPTTA